MVISLRPIRKKILIILALAVLCTIVSGIYRTRLANESLQASGEYDEEVVAAFMSAIDNFAQEDNDIELFDIEKGEVVERFKLTEQIRNAVLTHLDNISGMYVKVNAFPSKGRILKVRIEPQAEIVNKWPNSYGIFLASNVFFIYPDSGTPFILMLDSSNRPLFFNFEAENKYDLLDYLGIK